MKITRINEISFDRNENRIFDTRRSLDCNILPIDWIHSMKCKGKDGTTKEKHNQILTVHWNGNQR